jgi:uncharacterized protein YciI
MRNLLLLASLFSTAALSQPPTGQFLLRIEPTRAGFTLQNMTPEEGRLAAQHIQYLKSLLDSGKLSLAAQAFDPKSFWGIVIVDAPDRETARALLDADPMIKANMFRGEVIPVRVVMDKPQVPSPAVSKDLEGDWAGTLKMAAAELPVAVHFKNRHTVDATIDIPAQKAMGMPLGGVKQTGDKVEFRLNAARAAFQGTLNKDCTELTGEIAQGSQSMSVTLKKK